MIGDEKDKGALSRHYEKFFLALLSSSLLFACTVSYINAYRMAHIITSIYPDDLIRRLKVSFGEIE